jgi:hypothetical protein
MYSNVILIVMIIANLSEAATTCDSSLCDPLNTPAGYFCSMDSVLGCGLICVDLDVCAPETPPIMIVPEKTTQKPDLISFSTPPPAGQVFPPEDLIKLNPTDSKPISIKVR